MCDENMNPNDDHIKSLVKRKKSGSSSSISNQKNIKKTFNNKLPVTIVDNDNDNDPNVVKSSSSSNNTSLSLSFESYLDSMAIFGHDKTALIGSFGLFLLSLVLSLHMNNNTSFLQTLIPSSWLFLFSQQSSSSSSSFTLTAEQEQLYQKLGPIPHMDEPYIYHINDLLGHDNQYNMTLLRKVYQRDGVVAIRGLLSSTLLQRLDIASAKHVQEEWDKQVEKSNAAGRAGPRKTRQGTQFFLNRNHLALTDLPFPFYSLSSSSSTNNNSSSCSATAAAAATAYNETLQQYSSSTATADDDDDDYNESSNEMITMMNPFLQAALMSQIPIMAATLLGLSLDNADVASTTVSADISSSADSTSTNSNDNNNLRLIRDIFLAKDDDPYICGWHVDDFGFWPVTAASPPGINAWIALDDYNVNDIDGGGFALAIGSHTASWRHEAQMVTGASTTAPLDGYTCAKDLFEQRTGSGTCNLKMSAPHLHRRMEETKRIYPKLIKGDVILHDRWLFHRTVAPILNQKQQQQQHDENSVNDNNDSQQQQQPPLPPPIIMRRYSIRYGPGSSVIPPGYGTELSVLWDDTNGGKTANQVCSSGSNSSSSSNNNTTITIYPWYPQAWPNVLQNELTSIQSLVQEQFPVALKRQERHLKEMKPYRKRLARQQNRPTLAGNKK